MSDVCREVSNKADLMKRFCKEQADTAELACIKVPPYLFGLLSSDSGSTRFRFRKKIQIFCSCFENYNTEGYKCQGNQNFAC